MNKKILGFAMIGMLAACGGTTPAQTDATDDRGAETGTICNGSVVQYGLDVSYFQGQPNWTSVRNSGRNFALIRHSDGSFLDPERFNNWNNAKAAGMTVGFYQFFRASQDAVSQANLVVQALTTVGGKGRPNLPAVIDIETYDGQSGSTVISKVNQWLNYIQANTGRQPTLYTSPGFWGGLGYPTPSPLPYLWVAHWGVSCPTVPSPWGRLRFWQYSSTGSVSGISGAVDLDTYNGSLTEMQGL
ncbi:MAG TPA: glycoside hydrolase family 25 protein [Polyangia bacterium]|jgi:GH25 family lysozyme M1 (1,4-beta-N-acetylmuramidase)|nr:glycoside hydrolase family 25 protein [Polyangia bacterium]